MREGLPTTTRERTIADLVEDRNDFSIVGNALRDAARQSRLDVDRLTELLSTLAERNGHRRGDGDALLEELMRVAGIDPESIAKQIASIPSLGGLVAAQYLENLPKTDTTSRLAAEIASSSEGSIHSRLAEQLHAVDWASIALATQPTE